MKRAFIAILLVTALIAPAFGQFAPASLESGMTFDLFTNEIDQAFQINADFGASDGSFIFAGLGNPVAGDATFLSERAFDTALAGPLSFGYYMAGSLPLSFYSALDMAALLNRSIVKAYTTHTYSGAPVPVVSGTTTTNYYWITSSESHTPTGTISLRDYDIGFQALGKVGPAVIGLYLNLAADNSAADTTAANGFFETVVTTTNYNSAAATVAPVATVDYTVTKSSTNVDSTAIPLVTTAGEYSFSDTIRFAIPFAMRTGSIEHRAYLDATFGTTDDSAAYSIAETAHASTVGLGSVSDRTLSITSKQSATDLALNYSMLMPAEDGAWIAGARFELGINGDEYAFDDLIRPYDLSVLATKTALAGGTHEVASATYESGIDLGGSLSAGKLYSFKPAKALAFKVAPSVGFGVSNVTNPDGSGVGAAYLTGSSSYDQPLNATGAYDGTTYDLVATSVTGTPAQTFEIEGTLTVPMGLTVQPEGWKFGIMMGAAPSVSMAYATATTESFAATTTTRTYTGDTVTATVIETVADAPASKTSEFTPSFSEYHYFGITVSLDGGVRFDARINGNLLNFESYTIQAYIPLK
ncbi:MAG TPA: hypothetical protein P5298_10680 [Spirochaetia bacterium]|nr:hypothetical protein [Spirochaetaceae bacterium]HPE89323.1 hypothetical protein [Spirochaetales bacterium]HRW24866.1 hypothetical protein [Spirochaetia bacterium]